MSRKGRGGTAVSAIACWRIGLQAWLAALGELPAPPEYTRERPSDRRSGYRRSLLGQNPLPGDPDGDRAAGQRRQLAERVAVQVDHPAAAASAPVDQPHVDAAARSADGHGPAAPATDAERRSGRRVHAPGVVACGRRSRPAWQYQLAVPRTLCDGFAGGFGLGVAFSTDSARTGWFGSARGSNERGCSWKSPILTGDAGAPYSIDGSGAGVPATESATTTGRKSPGSREEGVAGGRAVVAVAAVSDRDRGQDGQRHRSSDIQTAAPATARPSGRDRSSVDMRGRFAAAGWQTVRLSRSVPCRTVSRPLVGASRNAGAMTGDECQARLRSRSRKGSGTTVAATRPRRPSTVHSTSSRLPGCS